MQTDPRRIQFLSKKETFYFFRFFPIFSIFRKKVHIIPLLFCAKIIFHKTGLGFSPKYPNISGFCPPNTPIFLGFTPEKYIFLSFFGNIEQQKWSILAKNEQLNTVYFKTIIESFLTGNLAFFPDYNGIITVL